jgi:hypothetical protein
MPHLYPQNLPTKTLTDTIPPSTLQRSAEMFSDSQGFSNPTIRTIRLEDDGDDLRVLIISKSSRKFGMLRQYYLLEGIKQSTRGTGTCRHVRLTQHTHTQHSVQSV